MDTTQMKAKEHFIEHGYYLEKSVFAEDDALDVARWLRSQNQETLAKSQSDQEPGVRLAVLQNVHKIDTPIKTIATDKRMLSLAGDLLGSDVYIWSSKINMKAAWCGTAEYFHQDFTYWKGRGYQRDQMMACMVFLDPHRFETAALHVLEGSHKLGPIEHDHFINVNGLSKFMIPPAKMTELSKTCPLKVIEANPGDVLYFHAGLIHGSSHNISGNPRMILLSQLNSFDNKPTEVGANARKFNLERCLFELENAKAKYEFFKAKYQTQIDSLDPTFNSPIPDEEREKLP